jgi:antitoxin ParD1/3/4
MPKSTSVTAADPFDEFIERQVDEGRYDSPTDVVQAGLHLLEEQESMLEAALIEGEQSGPGEPFDFDAFIKEKQQARRSPK